MQRPEAAIIQAANWKSKMVTPEAVDAWMGGMAELVKSRQPASQMIVFPPYLYIERARTLIQQHSLPIALGAQDISRYSSEDKPVTGEVTAEMLKAAGVEWVIIGHSERRTKMGETDEILGEKSARAKAVGLKVMYCVPNAETPVPAGVDVIAYEPPAAIGSGMAQSPQEANSEIQKIKQATGISVILYGGSVTADNVASYTGQPDIQGDLIGGAGLKAGDFFALAVNSTPQT